MTASAGLPIRTTDDLEMLAALTAEALSSVNVSDEDIGRARAALQRGHALTFLRGQLLTQTEASGPWRVLKGAVR